MEQALQADDALMELAAICGADPAALDEILLQAGSSITSVLDDFIKTLRLESRIGSTLQEATRARLLESGDLSPNEAGAVFDRLKRSVRDESALSNPTTVDQWVLRKWLGIPQRTMLQTKPSAGANAIERRELLEELSRNLRSERCVLLYGLSKIGKSQLVSSLIDYDRRRDDYFWYTFAGDGSDLDRLTKQLVVWAGQRTGRWQVRDDVQNSGLPLIQVLERLSQFAIGEAFLVLDDCHKTAQSGVFELLHNLVRQAWSPCRLILISETKLPAVAALNIPATCVGGLSPKEAVLFALNLGCDLSDQLARAQFAILSIQVDGHPVMLRAAVKDLPSKPSSADVLALSQRIPSITSAEDFLSDLSSRIFFGLLQTPDQRTWLSRLSVIAFPFTQGLANRLARLEPRLQVLSADWAYLKSLLLDARSADRYSVPSLLQQMASSGVQIDERRTILTAAARYIFQRAAADQTIDFWDFQSALLALLAADRQEEATMRFVLAYSSLMTAPLHMLEPLFLVMNNQYTHAKIASPFSRWSMLQAELYLRLQDQQPPDQPKVYSLIRRMRLQACAAMGRGFRYARAMTHICIALLKIRSLEEGQELRRDQRYRIFSPLQTALRIALSSQDATFVANMLHFFDHESQFATRPDIELLKDALLLLPENEPLPLSVHALVTLYSNYAANSPDADVRMRIEAHAALYLAARRGDAYFACEHAVASVLHGKAHYSLARERLGRLLARADELRLSPAAVVHGILLIADIYWAENNPAKSAEYYGQILDADLGSEFLQQFVCERLCDSFIALGRFEKAAAAAIARMRSQRRGQTPEARARLYARLAYAYAKEGLLKKAAIACLGLSRLAASTPSGALDPLAGTVAGWVLGFFPQSDPMVPTGAVHLPNSAALSERVTPEKMADWRGYDPFRAKAITLVASIFERLEDWKRSELLYRKALDLIPGPENATKLSRQAAFANSVLLARVHIRLGKFNEAATEIQAASRYSADVRREEEPNWELPSGSIYALLKLILPSLQPCSDDAVLAFFDTLYDRSGLDGPRGWVRFAESEILFDRFAVQAAKKRLNEAMHLARSASEHDLFWLAVQHKLFYRMNQFYTRQEDWLHDAAEITLVLADDENFAAFRPRFADSVRHTAELSTSGPFRVLVVEISRLEREWQNNSFWIAAYAIWRAAGSARVLTGALNMLEHTLRTRAASVIESDLA
jgi:hypothetical protein